MTWGAANELTTLSAYHRLIAKTEHPQLVQMLQAIIKDERRHFAFYRAQARLRLHGPTAQRITRWAMDHLWAPVGTGVRPQSETDFVVAYLFGDTDAQGTLEDMQATMNELPGLRGIAGSSAMPSRRPAHVRPASRRSAGCSIRRSAALRGSRSREIVRLLSDPHRLIRLTGWMARKAGPREGRQGCRSTSCCTPEAACLRRTSSVTP